MDVQDPLEQFDSEPQESVTSQPFEESQAPVLDSARQAETAQETETDQSVEEEAVMDSSEMESEPVAAPSPRLEVDSAARSEAPSQTSTEPAWYVIHCYSGYENKVRHNLEQRIETMGMKNMFPRRRARFLAETHPDV